MTLQTALTALCVCLAMFGSPTAEAHGAWSHIHVTGWAIENLAPGPVRDFFESDPEVFNAALFGAAFTDSGYAPLPGDPLREAARAYGEHTHWEPFVQDFITWIIANDPPPWTSLESKKRVAFLMGCASHGLQDEIFDSLFLYQTDEHDAASQDSVDVATDGFLAIDGLIRFIPTPWIPTDTLLELYSDLDEAITADVMQHSVDLMFGAYINNTLGRAIIEGNGKTYLDELPWTKAYYLDVNIPGSLRAEIIPTGRYLEAIWKRLHNEFETDDTVTFVFPDSPRRLLDGQPDSPDSWVTFIYGIGVSSDTVSTALTSSDGEINIAHTTDGTRWGHNYPRLHRVKPLQSLAPGGFFTVTIQPSMQRIDGLITEQAIPHTFQVECLESDTTLCPKLELQSPSLDGWSPTTPIEDATDISPPPQDVGPEDAVEHGETVSISMNDGSGCSVTHTNPSLGLWLLVFLYITVLLALLLRPRIERRFEF